MCHLYPTYRVVHLGLHKFIAVDLFHQSSIIALYLFLQATLMSRMFDKAQERIQESGKGGEQTAKV